MKKLLFIGHSYHQKTKSADFLLDLLQTKYAITKCYVDPYNDENSNFDDISGNRYDYVVCWQIMYPLNKLRQIIKYEKCVFFPMFDGVCPLDDIKWGEYAKAKIICFCKHLYEDLRKRGFDCEYIQYFPNVQKTEISGDTTSLFFWQRREEINLQVIDKLFSPQEVTHIHLHKALDPQQNFIEHPLKQHCTISTWFDKRDDLYKTMLKSALYMAPRLEEGIGMSFLEAMAMGRCVIAPDNPTMNEYIEHGKTGYLYNLQNIKMISLKNIRQIQQNTLDCMIAGQKQWNERKYKIFDWIDEPVKSGRLNMRLMRDYKLFGLFTFLRVEEN
jgi:hypothetical protein